MHGLLLVSSFSRNSIACNALLGRSKPMTTTASHNGHATAPERVLFGAFDLRAKTWKLGCTTGHSQKPRERRIATCHQAPLLQEVAQAQKRFGLSDTAPAVSGDEAGREGFWWHRFL